MGEYWFLVHLAVFVAALFQAATGLGFGLLAGPVLLLAVGDVSAIQTSILLSLMIALILSPPLFKQADPAMLRHLLIGTVAGLPIGITIYCYADLRDLELLAGAAVLTMGLGVLLVARSAGPPRHRPLARYLDIAVGGVSGIMTVCLGMPGPAPAGWMAARSYEKAVIRATMLTLFVPAYSLALALQVSVATLTLDTWSTTATLAPATLIGLFCGKVVASRISERVFRLCISILLLSTAALLLIHGFGRFTS